MEGIILLNLITKKKISAGPDQVSWQHEEKYNSINLKKPNEDTKARKDASNKVEPDMSVWQVRF